jgi:hypothetical protein
MLAMNNCVSQSTRKTAYEMVFGQPVRNDHDFWIELHNQAIDKTIVDEEDLPKSITDTLNFIDNSVCTILF